MAGVEIRCDLTMATQTLAAMDAATLRAADDGWRMHLGASMIGRRCEREIWYGWRWATKPAHEARVLRLFQRGHDEEPRLAAWLRAAGIDVYLVDKNTGRQWSFASIGGHFGGSLDGVALGLLEAPKTWHLLEFKTHSAKSFNELSARGVRDAKPAHYAQMQCYMAWAGLTRALYVAVCKDDDRLHLERIDADPEYADALVARAQRIISAATPPERISNDPAWFECKFCGHQAVCHGTEVPVPTCRSCTHATPELEGEDGRWSCARNQGKALTAQQQKAGCQAHRYIPILLRNVAEPIDANESENWVKYRLHDGSGDFVNGPGPDGFGSDEIQASRHKSMLADSQVREVKKAWQRAKVVA